MPVFEHQFDVAAPVDAVAQFHFQPGVLKTLCPPLTFMQVHQFEPLANGSIAEFTMWVGPLPVYWKAVHSDVSPFGFTDTQTDGPMKRWVHTHRFEAISEQTSRVRDHIEFEHHRGLRGLRSRILFPPFSLTVLFGFRKQMTRQSINRTRE